MLWKVSSWVDVRLSPALPWHSNAGRISGASPANPRRNGNTREPAWMSLCHASRCVPSDEIAAGTSGHRLWYPQLVFMFILFRKLVNSWFMFSSTKHHNFRKHCLGVCFCRPFGSHMCALEWLWPNTLLLQWLTSVSIVNLLVAFLTDEGASDAMSYE